MLLSNVSLSKITKVKQLPLKGIRCIIKKPIAMKLSCETLLKNLGYVTDDLTFHSKEKSFDVDGLLFEKVAVDQTDAVECYRIYDNFSDSSWTLESKIVLNDSDLRMLCHIVARMAPHGSIARLQADGHRAGTVVVGLILCFDDKRIPVNLVSGDIGCGLTLVPFVNKQNVHLTDTKSTEYHSYVLACMRRSLKRGKLAEQGLSSSTYLKEAVEFYESGELEPWLDDMKYVLDTIGVAYGSDGTDVLAYIGKFAQSLGSSGNHFMELAVDDFDQYWLVIHSGSRALGAIVYTAIAEACRATHDGFEIATGKLAEFYTKAYDALNKFAKLNRVICAIAVLDNLGLETSAKALKNAMEASAIFAPAVSQCGNRDAILGLLGGLTHNGLKAFINDSEKTVMYVLSKGAIAIDRHGSSGIVALRAGEGCVVFTLVDATCPWREATLREAGELNYKPVFDAGDGVIFAGHGAGRSQSTSETARQSKFADIAAFFEKNEMVGNIAPGVLGDNPEVAYKPSSEILPKLPLSIACTSSLLKTRVSHKEGITYKKAMTCACGEYIESAGANKSEFASLWCDYNLVKSAIKPETYDAGCAMRDQLMARLESKYRD